MDSIQTKIKYHRTLIISHTLRLISGIRACHRADVLNNANCHSPFSDSVRDTEQGCWRMRGWKQDASTTLTQCRFLSKVSILPPPSLLKFFASTVSWECPACFCCCCQTCIWTPGVAGLYVETPVLRAYIRPNFHIFDVHFDIAIYTNKWHAGL